MAENYYLSIQMLLCYQLRSVSSFRIIVVCLVVFYHVCYN